MDLNFKNVNVEGRATNTGNQIFVQGNVEAKAELICSLCLRPFMFKVKVPLEETYHRKEASFVEQDDSERDYSGEEIDLTEAIQDALVLALPMKPMCKPDCKGLCIRCGQDLNVSRCDCTEQNIDLRLAVLSEFFNSTT